LDDVQREEKEIASHTKKQAKGEEWRGSNVIYYTINNLRRSFTNWLLNAAEFELSRAEGSFTSLRRDEDVSRDVTREKREGKAVKEELK
jgi:hypothetical protein